MPSILELPPEITQHIFQHLIRSLGLEAAVRVRFTCRIFDKEIQDAIWIMRALEDPTLTVGVQGEQIVAKYLLARTLADSTQRQHKLTTTILETAHSLQRMVATQLAHDESYYIQQACHATVRSYRKYRVPRNDRCCVSARSVLAAKHATFAPRENLLALAVYLSLNEVVSSLVTDGIEDLETCFGSPLVCAAVQPSASTLKLYLEARLEYRRHGEPIITYEDYLMHDGSEVATFRRSPPRDLTRQYYELAIACAITHGVPESVKLLMDACEEDRLIIKYLPPSALNMARTIIPDLSEKGMGWSCVLNYTPVRGRLDMTKLALDHGADPNSGIRRNSAHWTVLETAASYGHLDIFELLLERGADIHMKHHPAQRLLYHAIRGGSIEIVQICLNADVAFEGGGMDHTNYYHPLTTAVACKRLDLLKLLLSNGIRYDPGSNLDIYLSSQARKQKNPELDALFEAVRRDYRNVRPDPAVMPL